MCHPKKSNLGQISVPVASVETRLVYYYPCVRNSVGYRWSTWIWCVYISFTCLLESWRNVLVIMICCLGEHAFCYGTVLHEIVHIAPVWNTKLVSIDPLSCHRWLGWLRHGGDGCCHHSRLVVYQCCSGHGNELWWLWLFFAFAWQNCPWFARGNASETVLIEAMLLVFVAMLPESLSSPSFLLLHGWMGFPDIDVACFAFFMNLHATKYSLTLQTIFSLTSQAAWGRQRECDSLDGRSHGGLCSLDNQPVWKLQTGESFASVSFVSISSCLENWLLC